MTYSAVCRNTLNVGVVVNVAARVPAGLVVPTVPLVGHQRDDASGVRTGCRLAIAVGVWDERAVDEDSWAADSKCLGS
jgi:hypothetical protein